MALVHVRDTSASPSLIVNPTSAQVTPGEYGSFQALVDGLSDTTVTWSANGGTCLDGGDWIAPMEPGTYTLTATSVADPTLKGSATVRVPLTVRIEPTSLTLNQGQDSAFHATVLGATDARVTWSSSASGAISSNGTFVAPFAAGTYSVTATSMADPSAQAHALVTVPEVSISLTMDADSVAAGDQLSGYATVLGTTRNQVVWSVVEGSGSVSPRFVDGSNARFTAPLTPGTAVIQAQSVADPTKTARTTITITEATARPRFTSATISPAGNLANGQPFTLAWDLTGASSVQLTGPRGTTLDVGGLTSIALNVADYLYDQDGGGNGLLQVTLVATNDGGSTERTLTAPVLYPIITSLAVSPGVVEPGGSAAVTAGFLNGTGRLDPSLGSLTSGTPLAFFPSGDPETRVVVENAYGCRAEQYLNVGVRDSKGGFSLLCRPETGKKAGSCSLLLRDGRVMTSALSGDPTRWPVGLLDPAAPGGGFEPVAAFPYPTSYDYQYNGLVYTYQHSQPSIEQLMELPDGRVVGFGFQQEFPVYNPLTGMVSSSAVIANSRFGWPWEESSYTMLTDGSVLLAGGAFYPGWERYGFPFYNARWDPAADSYRAVGSMVHPRAGHRAIRLLDGRVLIVGGWDNDGTILAAEVFDPATNTFSALGDAHSRNPELLLEPDGRVLVLGAVVERFDPATGSFTLLKGHNDRAEDSALPLVTLGDSRVLSGHPNAWNTLFDPSTLQYRQAASGDAEMDEAYYGSTLGLPDGGALLMGSLLVKYSPSPDLAIQPARASTRAGQALALTPSTTVTWTVNPSDATLSSSGSFLASRTGTYVVTARDAAGNKAHAWIEVLPAAKVRILPTSWVDNQTTNKWLTLDPYISRGFSRRFLSQVDHVGDRSVVWSIDEGSAGGTISGDGLYTPPLALGTYHIRATSVADPSQSASVALQVVEPIVITPASAVLSAGTSQIFTAPEAVGWGSEKGAMGSEGLYSVTSGTPLGTWRVWALSASQAGKMGQALVTVVSNTALTVTPTSATLGTGGSLTFSAQEGGVPVAVSWVASTGSIDANGVFTAPKTAGNRDHHSDPGQRPDPARHQHRDGGGTAHHFLLRGEPRGGEARGECHPVLGRERCQQRDPGPRQPGCDRPEHHPPWPPTPPPPTP